MTAFYNEIDPYVAQWLRNLIAAGHIAPGVVDRRPIQEIEAWELAEFTQCHFFAGIGIWSHALRRAGWPDDRPIWTGSCPCQPFSAAGQRKGISDERHLWPYWHQLIDQCRPAIVLGEQVASKDGLGWLDLVSTDLEASGYAFGASDLCAAGFGGAHIRQRLYFVAHTHHAGPQGRDRMSECADELLARSRSVVGGLDDSASARHLGTVEGAEGNPWHQARVRLLGERCENDRLADADQQRSGGRRVRGPGEGTSEGAGAALERSAGLCQDRAAHALLLGWNPVDWLFCRDGKWRSVEPGTFPLADAAPARVGRLRAYGNALDAETATNFCEVVREIADDLRPLEREFDL